MIAILNKFKNVSPLDTYLITKLKYYFSVITCLTLATFWTFPAARSRLILGSVNFLVCIIFLLFLRTRLPVTGSQIPMIGKELIEKLKDI